MQHTAACDGPRHTHGRQPRAPVPLCIFARFTHLVGAVLRDHYNAVHVGDDNVAGGDAHARHLHRLTVRRRRHKAAGAVAREAACKHLPSWRDAIGEPR